MLLAASREKSSPKGKRKKAPDAPQAAIQIAAAIKRLGSD